MAVALGYLGLRVALGQLCSGRHDAGPGAQTERAALVYAVALPRHEVYDLVSAGAVKLAGVGVRPVQDVARELYDGYLHTQAEAEVRHAVLARVLRGEYLALDAARAEAAGHEDAVHVAEDVVHRLLRDGLGVHPRYLHLATQLIARVVERLGDGEVGVVQLHVLAHQGDAYRLAAALYALYHVAPLVQLRLAGVQTQLAADHAVQPLAREH